MSCLTLINKFFLNYRLTSRGIAWLTCIQLLLWMLLVIIDYYSLNYNNFDTGIFANLIANVIHSGNYYSTILAKHGFSDHFSPNLLLLIPLFKFYPSFLWLPFLKVVAYFSCIPILYALGKQILGKNHYGTQIVVFLWLINMPLGRTLYFEFQPSALALPFVLLAFLFAIKKENLKLILCLIFLLGFKEQLPLIWIAVGSFLIFLQNRSKIGFTLIVTGIFLGVIIVGYIMPAYNTTNSYQHLNKLGVLEMIPEKLLMLLMAFASVLFIPLVRPKSLLFIIPAFSLSLISGEVVMTSLSFHYQDLGLTVMFIGLFYGVKEIDSIPRLESFKKFLGSILFMIICLGINPRQPFLYLYRHWPTSEQKNIVEQIQEVRAKLPTLNQSPTIWITDSLGPYLYESNSLKSITDFEVINQIKDNKNVLIIISPKSNNYPLNKHAIEELEQQLLVFVKEKKLLQSHSFLPLNVFSSERIP